MGGCVVRPGMVGPAAVGVVTELEAFLADIEKRYGKAARKAAEKHITFDGKHPCEKPKRRKPQTHPSSVIDGHVADPFIRRAPR